MQLRAGLRVLRLDDEVVQLGLDPRWAVRVDGLRAAERDALLALRPGGPVPDDPPSGVTRDRWADLVQALAEARLVLPSAPHRPAPSAGAAEVAAWSLVDASGDGRGRVERRGHAVVGVLGLGPTGLGLAVALAAAGVGSLVLDDPAPVRSLDVGTGGYRWSDVGSPRQTVASRVVRDVAASLAPPDRTRDPDLLVSVEPDVVDPVRATSVLAAGVAHLSIVVREADVLVGPLVVPGVGPCLHCLELHRADADPAWPRLVTRLALDGAGPRRASHRCATEVPVLAGVAAHLGAAAALAYLDGAPPKPGSTWSVALPDAVPRGQVWERHPQCGCGGTIPPLTGSRGGGDLRRSAPVG